MVGGRRYETAVPSRGLLFAWKRVYLLAIDLIATSIGNHPGFVSGCKVSACLGGSSLILIKKLALGKIFCVFRLPFSVFRVLR